MALTATTITGAIAADSTQLTLTSATNIATGNLLLVDGEYMTVLDVTATPTIKVGRGQQGTAGLAHAVLSQAVFGLPGDFVFKNAPIILSVGADSTTYTAPVVDAVVLIQKATAIALTLAGPQKDQQNVVRFISGTAAAHVITYTAGFSANTTSSDVATFAATANASLTIQARAGTWAAIASVGVTIA